MNKSKKIRMWMVLLVLLVLLVLFTYPISAQETACNDGTDNDGDGYSVEGNACGEVDCNDADASVHPGASEVCDDGIDNNCDGFADCADTDCLSWTRVSDFIADNDATHYMRDDLTASDGTLYTCFIFTGLDNQYRLYRSDDDGVTWTTLPNTDFPDNVGLCSLAEGPDGKIYIGFYPKQVLVSADRGDTWGPVGVPWDINTLEVIKVIDDGSPEGALVFGGSKDIDNEGFGMGVWKEGPGPVLSYNEPGHATSLSHGGISSDGGYWVLADSANNIYSTSNEFFTNWGQYQAGIAQENDFHYVKLLSDGWYAAAIEIEIPSDILANRECHGAIYKAQFAPQFFSRVSTYTTGDISSIKCEDYTYDLAEDSNGIIYLKHQFSPSFLISTDRGVNWMAADNTAIPGGIGGLGILVSFINTKEGDVLVFADNGIFKLECSAAAPSCVCNDNSCNPANIGQVCDGCNYVDAPAENCAVAGDEDCDGLSDNLDPDCGPVCTDNDGDGYSVEGNACGEVDCNDADASVHPGASEVCDDGIDNNCDGHDSECLKKCEDYGGTRCSIGDICSRGIMESSLDTNFCCVGGECARGLMDISDFDFGICHKEPCLLPGACFNPETYFEQNGKDTLVVNDDITICPGRYELPDISLDGIFRFEGDNVNPITLEGSGAEIVGDGTGLGIVLDRRDHITINNLKISNYETAIDVASSNNNFQKNMLNSTNDLVLEDTSTLNTITENHFYGSGVTNLGFQNSFCNGDKGNFYEEHIGFDKMGGYGTSNPDCGPSNITSPKMASIYRPGSTMVIGYTEQSARDPTKITYWIGYSRDMSSWQAINPGRPGTSMSWSIPEDIVQDDYYIKVQPYDGFAWGTPNVTKIAISDYGYLTGTVKCGADPVPGATVHVEGYPDSGDTAGTTGDYTITDSPLGRRVLIAYASGTNAQKKEFYLDPNSPDPRIEDFDFDNVCQIVFDCQPDCTIGADACVAQCDGVNDCNFLPGCENKKKGSRISFGGDSEYICCEGEEVPVVKNPITVDVGEDADAVDMKRLIYGGDIKDELITVHITVVNK